MRSKTEPLRIPGRAFDQLLGAGRMQGPPAVQVAAPMLLPDERLNLAPHFRARVI